jgi:hypothetical protein
MEDTTISTFDESFAAGHDITDEVLLAATLKVGIDTMRLEVRLLTPRTSVVPSAPVICSP